MTMTRQVLKVLPATSASQRAAWVWQRVLAKAAGAAAPDRREFEEHYGQEWPDELPMEESFAQKSEVLDGRIRGSLAQMKEPWPARAQFLGRQSSNRLGPLHRYRVRSHHTLIRQTWSRRFRIRRWPNLSVSD